MRKKKSNKDLLSGVFINCPFDDEYQPLFRAMIFTVLDCGFLPRTALDASDSDQIRIYKIMHLIGESRYSIHDISRTELDKVTGLPRFNMPFEFGIDIGAIRFGNSEQKKKSCLVLDREKYRYRSFISDISGQDIRTHDGKESEIIRAVRDWLMEKSSRTTIPGAHIIQERYQRFINDLPMLCKLLQWEVGALTAIEYKSAVVNWLQENTNGE
jgi:hypothetical protein